MKLTHKGQQLMERIGGGFASSLAKTYLRADLDNQDRIERAWPDLICQYNDMAAELEKQEGKFD